MTSRLRDDRGFTLIELLLVMSLALVILGATLTSVTNYYRNQKSNQQLNENAQTAREDVEGLPSGAFSPISER